MTERSTLNQQDSECVQIVRQSLLYHLTVNGRPVTIFPDQPLGLPRVLSTGYWRQGGWTVTLITHLHLVLKFGMLRAPPFSVEAL